MTASDPSPVLGSGNWSFRPDPDWPYLSHDLRLGDVAGLAIDDDDNIVLFNRGETPVVVVRPEGELVTCWGVDEFKNPHGAAFGADGYLYLTDNGLHVVRKYSLEGDLLMQIGTDEKPSEFMSGEPFNRCTHATAGPSGDVYVTDGYHNAVVHRFNLNGELLATWGRPGTRSGEFNLPHNIACDSEGRVYVADRENDRVQIFTADGAYLRQVVNMHRPSALALGRSAQPEIIVGELPSFLEVNRETPNVGACVTVFDAAGAELATLRRDPAIGREPGQFLSPHSIAMDSHGDLYVGEVGRADWRSLFGAEPVPDDLRGVQKLRRVIAR